MNSNYLLGFILIMNNPLCCCFFLTFYSYNQSAGDVLVGVLVFCSRLCAQSLMLRNVLEDESLTSQWSGFFPLAFRFLFGLLSISLRIRKGKKAICSSSRIYKLVSDTKRHRDERCALKRPDEVVFSEVDR